MRNNSQPRAITCNRREYALNILMLKDIRTQDWCSDNCNWLTLMGLITYWWSLSWIDGAYHGMWVLWWVFSHRVGRPLWESHPRPCDAEAWKWLSTILCFGRGSPCARFQVCAHLRSLHVTTQFDSWAWNRGTQTLGSNGSTHVAHYEHCYAWEWLTLVSSHTYRHLPIVLSQSQSCNHRLTRMHYVQTSHTNHP